MLSFVATVSPIVSRHVAHHAEAALSQLGEDGQRSLGEFDPGHRARLVDRLVRNLHLSVNEAPALERELLRATAAEPRGTYEWALSSASAFVELRSGLRYLGTWVGLTWSELSRLQAVIGNLARWVQASGDGTLRATVQAHAVHFAMSLRRSGHDARLLRSSPFVAAVGDVAAGLTTRDVGELVWLEFDLAAR